MPTSRVGRIAAFICFALLAAICITTNAFLAYQVNYPLRTLRVRIILDPANPPIPGLLPEVLKAQIESLSGFFDQAAGIHLVVTGVTDVKLPAQKLDPNALRRYLDVRTPRDNADILVAFWSPFDNDPRLGSALPLSAIAVVRIDPGNPPSNRLILAHQLLTLFGVAASSDAQCVMHAPPSKLALDSASAAELNETRLFDFSHGIGGMNRRMQNRVLSSIERQLRAQPPSDKTRTAHIVLAELYQRESQFPAAVQQFRAAVRSDPNSLTAHLGLSMALAQAGEFPEAIDEAHKCITLAPNQADPRYRLGFVLVRSGSPEAAIAEFRQAIALQPNSIRNRTGLAVAYAASIGEFDAAEHEFQEALKIEPQNPGLLADIDYVNRLRVRLNKQLEVAESDVRSQPDSGAAHDSVALLLLRLGKVDKALAEAQEAIKLGPNAWHPHYTLALTLYANHDYSGSATALADAERLGSGERPFLEDALRNAAARPPNPQPTK